MNESQNGNGHGIFSLAPKTDPEVIAVLESRRDARADDRLTSSEKAFFDEVADRALNPEFYEAKGIVVISDPIIAQVFGVTPRTVFTWKKRVEACGYISLGFQARTNMWPITKYYLTCLHRPMNRERTDAEGTYGVGKNRSWPGQASLGARTPGQPSLPLPGSRSVKTSGETKTAPGSANPPPAAKSAEMQGISGLTRKKLPVSPEANFGSHPKSISGLTRSQFRARPEVDFGPDPKPISGETRNPRRAAPEADFQHKKAKVEGEALLKGVRMPPPPEKEPGGTKPEGNGDAFETWRRSLATYFPSRLEKLESTIKARLATARSETVKAGLRRQLEAVRETLLPTIKEPNPVHSPAPAPVKPALPKIPLAKAKALLSAGLKAEGLRR